MTANKIKDYISNFVEIILSIATQSDVETKQSPFIITLVAFAMCLGVCLIAAAAIVALVIAIS